MFFKKAKSVKKAVLEEALGLCVVANKRERKERSEMNGGILRGGETAN